MSGEHQTGQAPAARAGTALARGPDHARLAIEEPTVNPKLITESRLLSLTLMTTNSFGAVTDPKPFTTGKLLVTAAATQ